MPAPRYSFRRATTIRRSPRCTNTPPTMRWGIGRPGAKSAVENPKFEIRSAKSEIRNPKFEGNLKYGPVGESEGWGPKPRLLFADLRFGFRISDLPGEDMVSQSNL